MAAGSAWAAGGARAADRCADAPARERSGSTGAHAGIPTGAAATGLGRRSQRADRLPFRCGGCRPCSQLCGRIDRARAGRHQGFRYRSHGSGAASDPHRADQVRASPGPVNAGFVDSLARPGGNATGFSVFEEYGTSGKWLELLKEAAPQVTRVAVLRDPTIAAGIGQTGAIQSVAPSLGVQVSPVGVRDASEI